MRRLLALLPATATVALIGASIGLLVPVSATVDLSILFPLFFFAVMHAAVSLVLIKWVGPARSVAMQSLLVLVVSVLCFWNASLIRQYLLEGAIAPGQQIVDAIERFERDNLRAPLTLSELVPAYLPRIPRSGLLFCGNFEYRRSYRFGEDDGWELTLDCKLHYPNGVLTYPASEPSHLVRDRTESGWGWLLFSD